MYIHRAILLLIFHCVTFSVANGQNLIPNPGFETMRYCPTGHSQFKDNVGNWFSPNRATPDLYSTCSSTIRTRATKNMMATTALVSGNNYAGIIVYQLGVKNYREYAAVKLDTTLEKGSEYNFSMFVRVAEHQPYACEAIQVQFMSEYKFQDDSYNYVKRAGRIFDLPIPNPDTAQWIEVKFSFAADGNERYLMIGSFKSDADASVNHNNSFDKTIGEKPIYAYYLLDSVTLVKKSSPVVSNVKRDTLDSLSQSIVRYLKMHDISNYLGIPAGNFIDSIPYSHSNFTFGQEDFHICRIYYSYLGTKLDVIIGVSDSPYEYSLETMKLLEREPERMLGLNVSSICVSVGRECLVEAEK